MFGGSVITKNPKYYQIIAYKIKERFKVNIKIEMASSQVNTPLLGAKHLGKDVEI